MTKMLRALSALLLLSITAHAQVPGQLASGTVWGNPTAARAPGSPATLTALIDRAIGLTQGSMLYRNATVWTPLTPGTAGLPLLSGGAAANLAYGILGPAAGGTGINNGTFTETRGGNLSLPVVSQGDLWFGSAAGTISALAKSASASQFVKNSGTANNPAWAQPAIADISGWGTGVATAVGVNVGTNGAPVIKGGALGAPSDFGSGVATALAINIGSGGSPVLNGGALGTPSSGTLTNVSGLPIAGVTGWGTGIATALAVNVGTAGAPVVNGGALGTPSGGTLTSATGLPAAGVVGTAATLTVADQTLSGGANVTAGNLGTKSNGTATIDCGTVPLQYLTNGGGFTLAAPSNDGSCMVQVTNNGSAGTVTFSGFTVGASTGATLTTTNTNKFIISIARINGSSVYFVTAQQ